MQWLANLINAYWSLTQFRTWVRLYTYPKFEYFILYLNFKFLFLFLDCPRPTVTEGVIFKIFAVLNQGILQLYDCVSYFNFFGQLSNVWGIKVQMRKRKIRWEGVISSHSASFCSVFIQRTWVLIAEIVGFHFLYILNRHRGSMRTRMTIIIN